MSQPQTAPIRPRPGARRPGTPGHTRSTRNAVPAPSWRSGLGMLVVAAAVLIVLLAQSAAMAFRAAAAADLAALAAADAARGITPGEPCAVAADVARRNGARVLSCLEGAGSTVQVRTELDIRTPLGGATGLARAGPPP